MEKIYEKYGSNTYHFEKYNNIYEYIIFMNGVITLFEERKITNLYNFQKNTEFISKMIKGYHFKNLPEEQKMAILGEIENGYQLMFQLKNDYLMPKDLTLEFAKYVNFLHIAKMMTLYFIEEHNLNKKNSFLISLLERNQTDDLFNTNEPIEISTFVKYQPINDKQKDKIIKEMSEKNEDLIPYLEKEMELSNVFPFENVYFYGLSSQLDEILNEYGEFLNFSQELLPNYFISKNKYIDLIYSFIPKKIKYNLIKEFIDIDVKKVYIVEKLLKEKNYQGDFLYLLPIIYILENYEIERKLYETIFKEFLSGFQSFKFVKPLLKKEVFDKFGSVVYFEKAIYAYIRLFLDVLDFSGIHLIIDTIDEKSEEASIELQDNFKFYSFLNMSKKLTLEEILETGFFESIEELNELLKKSNFPMDDAIEFVFKSNNNLIKIDKEIELLSKKIKEELQSSKATKGIDKLISTLPGIKVKKPIDVISKNNLDNLRFPADFNDKIPKKKTTDLSKVLDIEKVTFDKFKQVEKEIEYNHLEGIVETFGEIILNNFNEIALIMDENIHNLPDVNNFPEEQKYANAKTNKKLPKLDKSGDSNSTSSSSSTSSNTTSPTSSNSAGTNGSGGSGDSNDSNDSGNSGGSGSNGSGGSSGSKKEKTTFLEDLRNKFLQWASKINQFSQKLMEYAQKFQNKLQEYANKLSELVNKGIAEVQKWLDENLKKVQDFLQKYINKFADFVNSLLGPIQALFDMISALLCLLKALLCLLGMLLNLLDTIGDTIDNLGDAIANFVGSIDQFGADMIGALKNSISGALGMFGLSPDDLCKNDGKSFMDSMKDGVKKWAEEQEKKYADMFEKMLEDGLKCKIAAPKFHFNGLKFNFSLSFPNFKLNMPSC